MTKEQLFNLLNRYIPQVYLNEIPENEIDMILDIWAEALSKSSDDIQNIENLYSIDTIPEKFLPFLAYIIGFVYDFSDTSIENETLYRNQLKQAVQWMKLKGTALGIKQYLSSLAVKVDIDELWYDSSYANLIPSKALIKVVENEIFQKDIENNSIKILRANCGINVDRVNPMLKNYISKSFIHTNIKNGTIRVTIQQEESGVWVDKTYLKQDANNNFIYDGLHEIEVNLGKAFVLGSKQEEFEFNNTNNKISLKVDGGLVQTITLPIGVKTAGAIVNEINNQTTNVLAEVVDHRIQISNIANSYYATLEVVDTVNNAYDVLGIDIGTYKAKTKTEFRELSEIMTLELKDYYNFKEHKARVLVSYHYIKYVQPDGIKDYDYSTGAKSNWFSVTISPANENFVFNTQAIDNIINIVKLEVKPFHALLDAVNYLQEFEDIIEELNEEVTGEIYTCLPDSITMCVNNGGGCCLYHNNDLHLQPYDLINLPCNGRQIWINHDGNRYIDDQNKVCVYHRDLGELPKLIGTKQEPFNITATSNNLNFYIPGDRGYDMKLSVGIRTAESIATEINALALNQIVIPAFVHLQGFHDNLFVATYSTDGDYDEIFVKEVSIDSNGTVTLDIETMEPIKVMISSSGIYVQDFVDQTNIVIPATTHGISTAQNLQVQIYDDGAPRKMILPNKLEVDSNGDVTIEFETTQSGKIVIRKPGSYVHTFSISDGTTINIPESVHNLGKHVSCHVYETTEDNRELVSEIIEDRYTGDITIQLDEPTDGVAIIHDTFGYVNILTPSKKIKAFGINGFVRIVGLTPFDRITKSMSSLATYDSPNNVLDVLGFEKDVVIPGKLCLHTYNRKPHTVQFGGTANAPIVKIYETEPGLYREIYPNEISSDVYGTVQIEFDEQQDGIVMISGNYTYAKMFTNELSVTISNSEHHLGETSDIVVQVYDDSVPRIALLPKNVTVAGNGDVTIEFETEQSGLIILRNAPSFIKTFSNTSTLIIPGSEHNQQTANVAAFVYNAFGELIKPSNIEINVANYDVTITFDTEQDGFVVIDNAFQYVNTFTSSLLPSVIAPHDQVQAIRITPNVSSINIAGSDLCELDELEIEIQEAP